jgi:hypothetical protein
MAGVDLTTVKELMGHKTIAMTLRYAHHSTDHKQKAVQALECFGIQVPSICTTAEPEKLPTSYKPLKIQFS